MRPITLAFSLLMLLAQAASAQALSRQPYVQMATEESVTVVWRTVGGTTPIVRYGESPEELDIAVLPTQTVVRIGPDVRGPVGLPRLHSAPLDTYQYETTIFGLQAGTTYYYGVYDDGELLAGGDRDHHFTTLPPGGTTSPLRLWVTGDTGEGSESQIAAFEAMRRYVEADERPIDAYLHLGDMAYEEGADEEFSGHYFDIYAELIRNTVVWPTMGNHEGITASGVTQIGPYYDAYVVPTQAEAGGVPSGTEAYYSFDIGHVHFICLNSHDLDRSPTADMALWLKADLEMADADWLIAFWHHPPYTKGTHDSDAEIELIEMREMIMPILESGGVDLVLCGHSHIYERSMLIDGAYETPTTSEGVVFDDGDGHPQGDGAYRKGSGLRANEGTVAVVAGNGEGAGFSFGLNPVMRVVSTEVGSVILDIDDDVLTAKMINSDAEVRDEFQLIKRGEVDQEIVEFPWQPVGPEYLVERFEPGVTVVEIAPVPAAPDAVIRYSTDGSVPTTDSPIYSGPVSLPDAGRVRGFSVWNGGQRVGPTASSPSLSSAISIHRYPSSAADDGVERSDGTVTLDGETVQLGNGGVVGLRFRDVRLTPDLYLVRAYVQFQKAATPERMPTEGAIWAERVADSPPFTTAEDEFTSRPGTSFIPWIVRTWSGPTVRDLNTITPDLRPIIRQVIDQPGWSRGNAMSFFFHHTGEGRTAGAFDGGKASAATLAVIHIDPVGLGGRLAEQAPSIERLFNGRYLLKMRWPEQQIVSDLGLSHQFESSPDLAEWDVIQPVHQGLTRVGADGFGELFAELSPGFGEREYYFRVRIFQDQPDP